MHWGAAKGHAGIVQYLIDNFSSGINIHEEVSISSEPFIHNTFGFDLRCSVAYKLKNWLIS